MILPLKHHEVEFIFKDRDNELKLDLIDGYITKKLHHETDDLKKLIKNLKLDAFKYPNLIRVLNKNTLYYYKRE